MKKKLLIAFIVLILAFVAVYCIVCNKKEETKDISMALSVISKTDDMSKTALVGKKMIFSSEDFDKYFGDTLMTSITIKSLPSNKEGSLCLGDTLVAVGQSINRDNLNLLNFKTDNQSESVSSFSFCRDKSEYEMKCNMYFVKSLSNAPEFSESQSFQNMTYSGVKVYGKVDTNSLNESKYMLLQNVENGKLQFDYVSGEYTYTPNETFVGTDYFKVVAYDKYGNYSKTKMISLDVNEFKSEYTMQDMIDKESYVSAIYMLEKSIMSSTSVGNQKLFFPNKKVSRLDFTVMVVNILCPDGVVEVENTGFADDDEIPKPLKGYIKKARDLGIITGEFQEGSGKFVFSPNKEITKAEMADMLNKILSIEAPLTESTFIDKYSIPTWAKDDISALCSVNIIEAKNGYIEANKTLNREEVAVILYNFSMLKK